MNSGRPRWWIAAIAIGWGAILVAGIVWSALYGEKSTRDQTSVADAQPVVDEAIARIVGAATLDGLSVASIGDFEAGRECDVTLVRGGARYQRYVNLLVAPDTEAALLQRIAERLPASYGAKVSATNPPRFSADAGAFVLVSGVVVAPGQVRLVADTGDCRILGDLAPTLAASAGTSERAAVDAALDKLGLAESESHVYTIACPEGGQLTTLVVRTQTLGAGLRALADEAGEVGGDNVMATAEAVAYRSGEIGVGVRAVDERITITATSGC